MATSRKGQFGDLAVVIRLLGSNYDFTTTEYNDENGIYEVINTPITQNIRSLIENKTQKYIGPNVLLAPPKQGVIVYIRKILSVFENDIDPSNPDYKTKVTVSYNNDVYKLMSQQKIQDSLYCYIGQLVNE